MADNSSFTKMPISNNILDSNYKKYDNVHKLDGVQLDPKQSKTINFKQDYMVIIRKKLYYAATAQKGGDENYLRIYQINDFTNIRTSQNIYSRPGTCSITLKGAERIICADRPSNINTEGWSDWKTMLKSWLNIDETNNSTKTGTSNWALSDANGVNFGNLFKAREAEYGWKYAEKCDWEPMDEIWIFGKTRNELYRDPTTKEYKFLPIFFGYIDSITKTFQAGKGGLLISIQASDHLKLLDLGKVVNSPTLKPGVSSGGGLDIRYPQDEFGLFVINDPYVNAAGQTTPDPNINIYQLDNVFSGKPPYEIINSLAVNSGIPEQYLTKRIEKIKSIPFVYKIKGQNGDMFTADLKNRLDVCRQAAEKLYLEFFADEEGNIVLKIPNYALGSNRLPDNNMGNVFPQDLLDSVGFRLEEDTSNTSTSSTSTLTPQSTPSPTYDNITNWPNMQNGSSGDSVKKLQKMLQILGYSVGSSGVDGIFGSNTTSAVKSFQREYGLTSDGVVGPQTKDKLNTCVNNVTYGWPQLSNGSTGTNVIKLQRLLTSLGYSTGGIDSIFGNNTKAAVKSFQGSHNCSVDGIVGPQTSAAINSAISSLIKGSVVVGSQKVGVMESESPGGGSTVYDSSGKPVAAILTSNKTITIPAKTTVNKTVTAVPVTSNSSNVVIYTVVKGDTLWGIAKKFLGNGTRWPEIYNANRSIIGKNPNILIPGMKLTIYKDGSGNGSNTSTAPTPQQQTQATVTPPKYKIVKGDTLSQKTDKYIPEIAPEYILSFTLIDTDKEIYNMFEVQMETNIIDINQKDTMLSRAIPDLDSIVRFGLRPAPGVVNTPLISNPIEAELFGIMMITRSLSNRYSGSLNIIEDSSIKIGNPVRFFMYDEHPMKETGLFPGTNAQAVFYTAGIERSIDPNGVSTMSLQLIAGRMMGQESIYDICLPFYKFYYDEKIEVDFSQALNDYSNYYLSGGRYFNYTVKMQDTLQKIIDRNYDGYYGNISPARYEEISYAIIGLNPDVFGTASSTMNYEQIDEHLYNGLNLKLPNKDSLRK